MNALTLPPIFAREVVISDAGIRPEQGSSGSGSVSGCLLVGDSTAWSAFELPKESSSYLPRVELPSGPAVVVRVRLPASYIAGFAIACRTPSIVCAFPPCVFTLFMTTVFMFSRARIPPNRGPGSGTPKQTLCDDDPLPYEISWSFVFFCSFTSFVCHFLFLSMFRRDINLTGLTLRVRCLC